MESLGEPSTTDAVPQSADNLNAISTVLMGHLATMTEAGDGRAYVAGRLTATLEVIARVSGELGDLARSTINEVAMASVSRIALIGATASDARDTMIEGETGVLRTAPAWARPVYEPSRRQPAPFGHRQKRQDQGACARQPARASQTNQEPRGGDDSGCHEPA
jgi:hypothetical protein